MRQYGLRTIIRYAIASIPRRLGFEARTAVPPIPSPLPAPAPTAANTVNEVQSHGAVFTVRPHSVDHELIAETWNVYLEWLRAVGRNEFRDVVDVGAHIGSFSIHLAKNATVTGSMVALEPEPDNYALLKHNLERNGLSDRIEALNLAASDSPEPLRFICSPDHNGAGHTIANTDRESIEVAAVDIREVLANRSRVLLKIDAEGAEYVLFRRIEPLRAKIDIVVGELHEARFGRPTDILRLLARRGFNVRSFGPSHLPMVLATRTGTGP